MLEQLLQLDTSLFTFLNQQGNPNWDTFWLFITEQKNSYPLVVLLLFLVYKNRGVKQMLLSVLFIALVFLWTDQVTNLFKISFKRPRPCDVEALSETIRFIYKRCSFYSFFSGHSSNSMAIAILAINLVSPKYRKIWIPLFAWAFCMGYSRIYVGVHYPLDVLCGFTFGALSGYGIYKLFILTVKKFNIP